MLSLDYKMLKLPMFKCSLLFATLFLLVYSCKTVAINLLRRHVFLWSKSLYSKILLTSSSVTIDITI